MTRHRPVCREVSTLRQAQVLPEPLSPVISPIPRNSSRWARRASVSRPAAEGNRSSGVISLSNGWRGRPNGWRYMSAASFRRARREVSQAQPLGGRVGVFPGNRDPGVLVALDEAVGVEIYALGRAEFFVLQPDFD